MGDRGARDGETVFLSGVFSETALGPDCHYDEIFENAGFSFFRFFATHREPFRSVSRHTNETSRVCAGTQSTIRRTRCEKYPPLPLPYS